MHALVAVVVVLFVITTVAHGLFAWIWPQPRRLRAVLELALERGLVLDKPGRDVAERLVVARRRGNFVGATAGAAAILGAWWMVHTLGFFRHWAAAIAGFVLAVTIPRVTGTLVAAAALRRALPAASDTRVARVSVPSLDDFLPPLARWYAIGLLAASGVAVSLASIFPPSDPPLPIGRRGLVVGWLAGAAAVAATELTARVVLREPRPASSAAALAVQDEIAGDLAWVVLTGAIGPSLVLGHVAGGLFPAAGGLAGWLVVLPLVAESRRRRRVGERLWQTPAVAGSGSRRVGRSEQAP